MNLENTNSFRKDNYYLQIVLLLLMPVIIYIYFLKWKTNTIYGDDLYLFQQHEGISGFSEKMNMPVTFEKYRPIHGLSMNFIMDWFQRNVDCYYLFNVTIQAINTFVFAAIVHLFLRSFFFSLAFSLIIGLSRFSFFNMTQLMNGGALEGLAITFFLASLFFIIKIVKRNLTEPELRQGLIYAIVFANLSMYTHERYIVFLLFIAAIILLAPPLKKLTRQQRIIFSALTIFSIILNVIIKKYVFNMPFFVGTGGTNIEFSFTSAITFFKEAVFSILQFNSGPEYLVGIPFSSLPQFSKFLVVALFGALIIIFGLYVMKARKTARLKRNEAVPDFFIFLCLIGLSVLFILPVILTIRLEQRWLQASYVLFVLGIIIALNSLDFRSSLSKRLSFCLVIFLFVCIDSTYLNRGGGNIYMSSSEDVASKFKRAMDAGTIKKGSSKLYIWEKQRDVNTENAIRWDLADGYFFNFYQDKKKEIVFLDSAYNKNYSFSFSSFAGFNPGTDQILFFGNEIIDLTNDYLLDSFKTISTKINELETIGDMAYDRNDLIINRESFPKFLLTGFYDDENGIRWTNGDATIEFKGQYQIADSVTLQLNTYLPEICAGITPRIILVDGNNLELSPSVTNRSGNEFTYQFTIDSAVALRKIRILSDTISAAPDPRKLSFPFINMKIMNKENKYARENGKIVDMQAKRRYVK